ncbi:MAG TPA: hypothetical protein PL185_08935 [Flavobacteriales bacterium]|jgi:hypothetical protein|nr:hypothetical protein [Flavobacteriales bacterium]HPH82690.1 hypothetical protein [Flavobacteriales bacterium]
MSKVIVLSGHGSWEMKDGYVTLPAKCSIKFYTCNMKTLSDGLGGDIDRGIVSGLDPDQEAGPFSTVPNMRLYPPAGLLIRTPDARTWNVVDLPGPVPHDNKNLQVRIANQYGGGGDLKTLLDMLRPAITGQEVTILWAACRAIGLKNAGGKSIGINTMQR